MRENLHLVACNKPRNMPLICHKFVVVVVKTNMPSGALSGETAGAGGTSKSSSAVKVKCCSYDKQSVCGEGWAGERVVQARPVDKT